MRPPGGNQRESFFPLPRSHLVAKAGLLWALAFRKPLHPGYREHLHTSTCGYLWKTQGEEQMGQRCSSEASATSRLASASSFS